MFAVKPTKEIFIHKFFMGFRSVTSDILFGVNHPDPKPYLKGGYDLYRDANKKEFKYLSEETGLDVLYSVDNRQIEKLPTADEMQYKLFRAILRAKLPTEIQQAYKDNTRIFNTVQLVIALARLSDLPDEGVHGTGNIDAKHVITKESEKIRSELLKKLMDAKDFDLGCRACVIYSLQKLDRQYQPTEIYDKLVKQIITSYEDLPVTFQGMLAICEPSMNLKYNHKFGENLLHSLERKVTGKLFIPGEIRPRFIGNTVAAVARKGKYFEFEKLINSLVSQFSRMKDYPMILSPKTLGLLLEGLGMMTFDITYQMQQEFVKAIIVHKNKIYDEQLSQIIYGVGKLGFLNNQLLEILRPNLNSAIDRFSAFQLYRLMKGLEEGGVTPDQDLLQLMLMRFNLLRKNKDVSGLNSVLMVRIFRILGCSKEESRQIIFEMKSEQDLIGKTGDLIEFQRRIRGALDYAAQ